MKKEKRNQKKRKNWEFFDVDFWSLMIILWSFMDGFERDDGRGSEYSNNDWNDSVRKYEN